MRTGNNKPRIMTILAITSQRINYRLKSGMALKRLLGCCPLLRSLPNRLSVVRRAYRILFPIIIRFLAIYTTAVSILNIRVRLVIRKRYINSFTSARRPLGIR
jgi:hypothetical protein